jgi:hypothetical protein
MSHTLRDKLLTDLRRISDLDPDREIEFHTSGERWAAALGRAKAIADMLAIDVEYASEEEPC